MNMKLKTTLLAAVLVAAGLVATTTHAATATDSMTVKITIQNVCTISTAPTDLDFGNTVSLTTAIDGLSTIAVTCSPSVAFDIGLDDGGSGNINARVMTLGLDTVGYQLYQDAGRTTVWGDTINTNTVSGTGIGTEQYFSVFGRVPTQAFPPAGTYTDSVTVTVTY